MMYIIVSCYLFVRLGGEEMAKTLLRMPDDLHEKIRWISYRTKKSQNSIIVDILQKELQGVNIPEEAKNGQE